METDTQGSPPERRHFLKELAAICIGAIVTLVPAAAGFLVVLDPLKKKKAAGDLVKVTNLASLPNDGVPRKFPVLSNREDAWNRFPSSPIGAVYLRRTGEKDIRALNVICPHAGCFVDYRSDLTGYFCPCHNSTFSIDGDINDPKSPSPRGLDELTVEIRNENEVWVKFQNYRTGKKEMEPLA